jgi:hypothetical protein
MDNKGCCMITPADNACSTEKPGPCGPGKGCCGKLLKGAIVGGIIMFAYLWASWMLLPWHKTTMMSFKDDKAVASVLSKNAEKSGIYMLPHCEWKSGKAADDATAPETAPAVEKPFAFVSVFTKGVDMKDMAPALAKQFGLCLLGAFLLTCLLKKAACCGCPILSSLKVGILVAAFHYLPNIIWFHFPLNYSLVGAADDVIAFTLAGAVISWCCCLKKSSCAPGKAGDKTSGCG